MPCLVLHDGLVVLIRLHLTLHVKSIAALPAVEPTSAHSTLPRLRRPLQTLRPELLPDHILRYVR
jgi:hypothetical protein